MIEQLTTHTPDDLERLATLVVDVGFNVHKTLGPGLLESVYEHCLAHDLAKRELKVERQVAQPITYDNVTLELGYRIDLLVNDAIIIEVKSVEATNAAHVAQLLTYLRMSRCRLGFIMNFSMPLFKNGVRRVVI